MNAKQQVRDFNKFQDRLKKLGMGMETQFILNDGDQWFELSFWLKGTNYRERGCMLTSCLDEEWVGDIYQRAYECLVDCVGNYRKRGDKLQ